MCQRIRIDALSSRLSYLLGGTAFLALTLGLHTAHAGGQGGFGGFFFLESDRGPVIKTAIP